MILVLSVADFLLAYVMRLHAILSEHFRSKRYNRARHKAFTSLMCDWSYFQGYSFGSTGSGPNHAATLFIATRLTTMLSIK
jgi:hypothetical protein